MTGTSKYQKARETIKKLDNKRMQLESQISELDQRLADIEDQIYEIEEEWRGFRNLRSEQD